jgi:hypothetical protein
MIEISRKIFASHTCLRYVHAYVTGNRSKARLLTFSLGIWPGMRPQHVNEPEADEPNQPFDPPPSK